MVQTQLNPLNLLAGKYALTWHNHVVFLVLSLLSLGFFDIDRLGGNFANWFIVFLAGYSITVVLIELGKSAIMQLDSSVRKAGLIILLLLLVGVFRGLAVFQTGFLLGLIPEIELIYRVVSAPIFVLTAYGLSNALVASFLSFRAEARRLASDLQRLNESRNAYESDLQYVNQQQRNRVRELLSAPMWELQKKLETADDPVKLQDALLTMKAINTDVVRPLSHELSATISSPIEQSPADNLIGQRFSWPKRVNLAETQPGWLFLGIISVLGLNSQIALTSLSRGLEIVFASLLPVILFFIAEKALFRKSEVATWQAFLISFLFGIVGSAIGGAVVIELGLATSGIFLWQTISLVLIIKIPNLTYGIFLVGLRQSLDQLAEVNSQQRSVNSRLRQQLWLGQKALAMELHGSVQATLQALALRLARMQDVNLLEISQVLEQVRKALSRIENQEYLAGQEFTSLLDELKELWEGTAEIDWRISGEARLMLEQDLGLARCTFEVIRESVTNAVKHGSASEIQIEIDLSELALILKISNNGQISEAQEESMGSELMDQLCLSRELRNEGRLVVVLAELALKPQVLQESLA